MSRHELLKLVPARPTLLDRIRSITLGPFNSKDKALAGLFGGGPTTSGVHVSSANVLSYSAVWSAVTMVSDDIASLPLHLYRNTANGGKDRFKAHSLYELLHDAPNPEMDANVFIKTLQAHRMIYQNAYAEIERDEAGRPLAIWPLVPERVSVQRDRGRLVYRVSNGTGADVFINPEDMIHLVGYSHDGTRGCELVTMARESFALGLAAEKFGGAFFGNGATMSGVISYPTAKPTDKVVKDTQQAIDARHQGVERAHKLLALYNGAKYERMGVNPNEGQFNETRVFQIREVARWFKIPPHKLGDLADATYSNVEQMQAAYLESCIRPYLKEWEQQLSRKLISRLERRQQFFEFDTHGFMSVDATSRAELYQAESHIGSVTINEIRNYENRNPVEGGDVPFVQLQSIPLDLARPYWEASIAQMEAKAEADRRPPPTPVVQNEPDPDDEADRAALRAAVDELKAALEAERVEKRQAIQKADDLSAALTSEQEKREQEQDEHLHTLELLETEKQERAQDILTLCAERDAVKAHAEAEEERLRVSRTELADVVSRHGVELDEERGRVREQQARADVAVAKADEARAEVVRVSELVKQAMTEKERAEEQVTEITAAFNASLTRNRATEQERDSEKARADAAESVKATALEHVAELAGENEILRGGMKSAQDSMLQADAAKVAAEQRAEAAERDKAIAEQAQHGANEALEHMRQREAKRMLDVIGAHRALMVQAMKRILAKETDRARRHQATPQKLRAWMDTYYVSESDDISEALLPIVRAHLAWMQSDEEPGLVADALAGEHVETSQQQLRAVMAVEDWTSALAQMLTRWEEKRPDQVADAFIRGGLAHVRNI